MNRDQNKTKNKLNQSIIEMRLGREKALKILIETRIRRKKKKQWWPQSPVISVIVNNTLVIDSNHLSCPDIEELVRGAKNFNDWRWGCFFFFFFETNSFDFSDISHHPGPRSIRTFATKNLPYPPPRGILLFVLLFRAPRLWTIFLESNWTYHQAFLWFINHFCHA